MEFATFFNLRRPQFVSKLVRHARGRRSRRSSSVPRVPSGSSRRAFSLLEVLVVIALIAMLMGMLLPMVAKAREQARYARWKLYSHGLQSDPDVCIYYNLENDRDNIAITNQAFASRAETDAPRLNGQLSYWTGTVVQPAYSSLLKQYWAQDGRFFRKPSLTFMNGSNQLLLFPAQMAIVGDVLHTTQQVSVAFWIAGSVQANSAVFYWPTFLGYQYPGLAAHVPWGDGNIYFTAGTTNNFLDQVKCAAPKQTKWQFWVFTKTCGAGGSMHIYQNGVELLPLTTVWGTPPLGVLNETNYPLSGEDMSATGAVIGNMPGGSFWTGVLDEFCMWSRVLTPSEIQAMYAAGRPD